MRYRRLGSTGLLVSEIGLGTGTFGGSTPQALGFGALNREQVGGVIGAAVDAGINIIDTADTYTGGDSETLIGHALSDLSLARDQVVIATKVCDRTGPGPNEVGATRSHILHSVETSLKRLQTDYIDLYMLHQYDPVTPLEETLYTLDTLVRQGKVRYIGCSNFFAWQAMQALGISGHRGYARFEAFEGMYAVSARDMERELVPMLLSQGVGLLVFNGLASGMLTGKYGRDGTKPAVGRMNTTLSNTAAAINRERVFDAVDAMRPMAERRGVSIAQIAIAWLLHQPVVTSVLTAVRHPDQLRDSVGATKVRLTAEELDALQAPGALAVEYPAWMQNSRVKKRFPGD